ncbi:uncharacterized protein LOC135841179 [Planococcus citri]|uniref:uncharacterized protein LOC135841179 n=1 Tax=Planococcus citri TaxID=170843 RepID=UPI0031F85746
MNVLLLLSMFAASSWGLKFSFTNNTELEIFRRQKLTMNCSSDEEIEWLIPNDSNAVIKHVSSYEASIEVNRTTKCDSGDYICRSKYNKNQFARIRIHVTGLRYSFKNGDYIIVKLGQEFNATCSDEGGVNWSSPPDSSAFVKKISLFEETIVFDGSALSDSGDYICQSKTYPREVVSFYIYVDGEV